MLTGWQPWGLLFAFALLVLGALVTEVVVRTVAQSDDAVETELRQYDPLSLEVEPHGELGFRQRPNQEFPYPNGTRALSNAMGYRGPLVSIAKPPDTYRVILLGGSQAHGWGVGDGGTIDAHLRSILGQRYPHLRMEVVNLAFDAYDSYQLYERLKSDGLQLDPNLIIVNSGIVDVGHGRFANLRDRDLRTFGWEPALQRIREERQRGWPSPSLHLKHVSYALLLLQHLRITWQGKPASTTEELRQLQIHDDAVDYFARNLLRLWDLAAQHEIPVIFSTPPSALVHAGAADSVREVSFWLGTAKATQRYREMLADRMEAVVRDLQRRGEPVVYMRLSLGPQWFIDDSHLSSDGNREMAQAVADAARPFIGDPAPRGDTPDRP